jgi:hypothetical protein
MTDDGVGVKSCDYSNFVVCPVSFRLSCVVSSVLVPWLTGVEVEVEVEGACGNLDLDLDLDLDSDLTLALAITLTLMYSRSPIGSGG